MKKRKTLIEADNPEYYAEMVRQWSESRKSERAQGKQKQGPFETASAEILEIVRQFLRSEIPKAQALQKLAGLERFWKREAGKIPEGSGWIADPENTDTHKVFIVPEGPPERYIIDGAEYLDGTARFEIDIIFHEIDEARKEIEAAGGDEPRASGPLPFFWNGSQALLVLVLKELHNLKLLEPFDPGDQGFPHEKTNAFFSLKGVKQPSIESLKSEWYRIDGLAGKTKVQGRVKVKELIEKVKSSPDFTQKHL